MATFSFGKSWFKYFRSEKIGLPPLGQSADRPCKSRASSRRWQTSRTRNVSALAGRAAARRHFDGRGSVDF
jgi:hypothetical protein